MYFLTNSQSLFYIPFLGRNIDMEAQNLLLVFLHQVRTNGMYDVAQKLRQPICRTLCEKL